MSKHVTIQHRLWKRFRSISSVFFISLIVLFSGLDLAISQDKSDVKDNASLAQVISEQKTSNKNLMSIHFTNVTLEKAFGILTDRINVGFSYNPDVMPNKIVSFEMSNVQAHEIIYKLLEGTNLEPVLPPSKDVIVIREKEPIETIEIIEQVIIGTVVDSETGEALPGVNVTATAESMDSPTGTITNMDGEYEIEVPDNVNTLVFSYIGYQSMEVSINGQTEINVELVQDVAMLGDVVVVGFGTVRQKDLTGSIATADMEAFQESPNYNLLQSLQGSVPGVQIGQVNRSGQEPSISIRGQTTIDGNQDPLIVVDGNIFRGRLGDLNPADVESVNVLKDASSKAIYGSQASNGVILVTTNQGQESQKPVINYSGSFSSQTPTVDLRPLNREEFLQKIREVEYNDAYLAPDYTQPNPDFDFANDTQLFEPLVRGIENGTDFDWWDAQTQTAMIMEHNISVSGGSETTTYYLSGGYTGQDGFILNDDYERVTGRMNIQTDIIDWLTVGINSFGAFSDFSGNSPSLGALVSGSVPVITPRNENGELILNPDNSNRVNPLLNAQADDRDLRNRISGNIYGIFEIPQLEGLSNRINYNNNYRWSSHSFSNPFGAGFTGEVFKINENILDATLENILTYEQQVKDHNFIITLVAGLNKVKFDQTEARGTNISDQALSFNSLQQATNQFISSSASDQFSVYQVGRINYNYKNRYLLTTSLRRDGFSGFAENKKFGLFPSVGLGWILSEESFFNIPEINFLKIRASYGESGNQTDPYSTIARVSTSDSYSYVFEGTTVSGQVPVSLANNTLEWETTSEFNIGIDYSILDDRVHGNFDYYSTNTTNLLWDLAIPTITGFSQVRSNIGEIDNTGFEFSIQTNPIRTVDFNWDVGITFSRNINEIVELSGFGIDGEPQDLIASGLFIGESIGAIYGYETEGIWQVDDVIPEGFSPGTYRVVDQNGDGLITPEDRKILGRQEPAFTMGIQNTLNYKEFSLRFFINIMQGGSNSFLAANSFNIPQREIAQQTNFFEFTDYWSPINPDAKFAASWNPANTQPPLYQSRSFIRLQDVSLSYQIDQKIAEKIGAQGIKVFASGKNLLTFTNWDGIDPETGQGVSPGNPFPVMKSYTVGLDISF